MIEATAAGRVVDSACATARADLDRLAGDLVATGADPDADDAILARDSGAHVFDDAAARQAGELTRQWTDAYWASEPESAHRFVVGSLPTLFDCINHTDLLITDISSVVADYLFSEKPYVVTNSAGLDHETFRELYPTAAAAELLDPDCAALAAIVTDLQHDRDRLVEQRAS